MNINAREILWCYNAAFGAEEPGQDFTEMYIKLNNKTYNAQTLASKMRCIKRFWGEIYIIKEKD